MNGLPSLRTRGTIPAHLPSRSAASIIVLGKPASTSSSGCSTDFGLPMISSGSYPYSLRAPSFQSTITPSVSVAISEHSVEESRMFSIHPAASSALLKVRPSADVVISTVLRSLTLWQLPECRTFGWDP